MGQKKQLTADLISEPKKRRRVGFSVIDAGVEACECTNIYLVSSKEEVGGTNGCLVEPVDLNSFFDEDGKIYGYKDLKINIYVSSISFHAYADITFLSRAEGGKGITDLKSALQKVFGENLVESKDEFLQTFSTDGQFVSNIISTGEILQLKAFDGLTYLNGNPEAATSELEVVRMVNSDSATGHLYCRLVPLVLLLVDGSNPIDVTDPDWELYLLIQRKKDEEGDASRRLVGFSAVYRFYHYPDNSRLRLSQILVLPPYQHKGYGTYLVEVLSNIAISENVHDLTVEEPLDYFQHVRTCVDIRRLLAYEQIQPAVNSAVSILKQGKLSKKTHMPSFIPPQSVVDDVRKTLKINKKQFLKCWEVLIYIGLNPIDKYVEDYVTIISNHVKEDVLGKDSGIGGKRVIDIPTCHDPEMSFVMFNSKNGEASSVEIDENKQSQQDQLQELVDERIKEIKLVAQKVEK